MRLAAACWAFPNRRTKPIGMPISPRRNDLLVPFALDTHGIFQPLGAKLDLNRPCLFVCLFPYGTFVCFAPYIPFYSKLQELMSIVIHRIRSDLYQSVLRQHTIKQLEVLFFHLRHPHFWAIFPFSCNCTIHHFQPLFFIAHIWCTVRKRPWWKI